MRVLILVIVVVGAGIFAYGALSRQPNVVAEMGVAAGRAGIAAR
jgi:hypothetical protein